MRAKARLPIGAVAILFTDIEGSTVLWEQDGARMSQALAAHDALARRVVESRHGTWSKRPATASMPSSTMCWMRSLRQWTCSRRSRIRLPPMAFRCAYAVACTRVWSSDATTITLAVRSTVRRGS